MAKAHETSIKKEIAKKKIQKRKDKEEKKAQRQSDKGKGLDAMMAYVDENGNLTDTPPDPSKRKEIKSEDISLSASANIQEESTGELEGTVTFFNTAKGFGFIKETKTQTSYFVHMNDLSGPITERDKVVFQIAKGHKGMHAIMVKKKK